MMRKKILSLALALALCLGLAVPAMAAGTTTKTVDGITITIDPNKNTISFTGSGILDEQLEYGIVGLLEPIGGPVDTVSINIDARITIIEQSLEGMKEWLLNYGVKHVNININSGFTDVKLSDYFSDPVAWAVSNNITAGTSATTFSPNENCTVAQILSFLWRAYGSPKSNRNNLFSDVKESDYYYNAALWAYEKGMVTGGTFGGDRPCTRSMAVTYMWKAADSPSTVFDIINHGVTLRGYHGSDGDVVIPDGVEEILEETFENCKNLNSVAIPSSVTAIDWNVFEDCNSLTDVYYEGSEAQWKAISIAPDNNALSKAAIHYNSKMPEQKPVITGFTDVPATADYAEAVKWAVDKGVTSGTSAATFSPDSVCTRGQIVTFMYRGLAK